MNERHVSPSALGKVGADLAERRDAEVGGDLAERRDAAATDLDLAGRVVELPSCARALTCRPFLRSGNRRGRDQVYGRATLLFEGSRVQASLPPVSTAFVAQTAPLISNADLTALYRSCQGSGL